MAIEYVAIAPGNEGRKEDEGIRILEELSFIRYPICIWTLHTMIINWVTSILAALKPHSRSDKSQ